MSCFHNSDDLSYLPKLKEAAPTEFAAWVGLDSQVGRWGRGTRRAHHEAGRQALRRR